MTASSGLRSPVSGYPETKQEEKMTEGYIEKRRLLQELPFISCLTVEARKMVRQKIEQMPEVSLL